ncbi:MAG TPA: DEAD/DEAH box helicase [Chloroflexia bacterium]|nr:DEAD/DEAH box helicase [Chloroflexia bacterium]
MDRATEPIADWTVVDTLTIDPRPGELFSTSDLPLSPYSKRLLATSFPDGVYRHQKEALRLNLQGKNICITTRTSSGKSLPFYLAAIEHFVRKPSTKIIAIYPQKALGKEQEERWKIALSNANVNAQVGRIDGQVPTAQRLELVRKASVLIFTPDTIHAWLLSNISQKAVQNFLKNTALIIVDEVHTYTGVFGSNAAFLYRRLQHAINLLGGSTQYICASATVADPINHVQNLIGTEFSHVGPELDTSPRHTIEINLVTPPKVADLLTEVSAYLTNLASQPSSRFIAFVDSRKQTEQISSIVSRSEDQEDDDAEEKLHLDHLEKLAVLPYRAGYEAQDRDIIQNRLSSGTLKGVVSTSALELGIDIQGLNVGVLVGVPRHSTSLQQRIGRIGRNTPGKIFIINSGTVFDEDVFRDPENLLNRPPAESALYLENTRIQYIHALCLARPGGEQDQLSTALHLDETTEFANSVNWPDGFIALCSRERRGEVPVDLQSMKLEGGEAPQYIYPLRDVESQFKVQLKQGPEQGNLGNLSFGQLLREAYPGAVYLYTTKAYRVYKILIPSKTVLVRHEKHYSTQPVTLPTQVFPNLSEGNVFQSRQFSDLILAEAVLQIRESVSGFRERRGPNEKTWNYPTDDIASGIYFTLPRFTRNYFSTGVIITHPALNTPGLQCDLLSEVFFEAFLILIPFERRDVNVASDEHRTERDAITEGSRFIALYDQTYGSLHLSGRLMEDGLLPRTLEKALELLDLEREAQIEVNPITRQVLQSMLNSARSQGADIRFESDGSLKAVDDSHERVIVPGSKGLSTKRFNEEFYVNAIFFSPKSGLNYRGRFASTADPTEVSIWPISDISEIPGESQIGLYNFETGQVEALHPAVPVHATPA